jgi:hypothetical protein
MEEEYGITFSEEQPEELFVDEPRSEEFVEEETQFVSQYKDLERIGGAEAMPEELKGVQRRTLSQKKQAELSLRSAFHALPDELSQGDVEAMITVAGKLPEFTLYNPRVLAVALLWYHRSERKQVASVLTSATDKSKEHFLKYAERLGSFKLQEAQEAFRKQKKKQKRKEVTTVKAKSEDLLAIHADLLRYMRMLAAAHL